MEPTASATGAPNSYPASTGNLGNDKLEPIFAEWKALMGEFRGEDSAGLAAFLDRAFAQETRGGSAELRNIFEQVAQKMKASLPQSAKAPSAEPRELIAALAGDHPEEKLAWIRFCVERGILTQNDAEELLSDFTRPPVETRIQQVANLAMNDPERFLQTMEHEIDLALEAQGGIVGSDVIRALLKKQLHEISRLP